MGVHSPFFHAVGHSPSAMHALYSVVRGLAISFAATFKAFGGIPSQPVLFLVLRFCRAVSTSVLFRLCMWIPLWPADFSLLSMCVNRLVLRSGFPMPSAMLAKILFQIICNFILVMTYCPFYI